MNFGFRGSNAAETYSHRLQPPASPSLDSGVLSGSMQPSSAGALDDASGDEWVLFSPRLGPADELASLDAADLHSSAQTVGQRDADLSLPGHNGDGSFVEPAAQPHSSNNNNNSTSARASGSGGGDWMERINIWRLEQSHLLFSEFQQRATTPAADGDDHGDDSIYFWRRLTRRAAQSIGHYLAWDDTVLDALFAPDFTPPDAQHHDHDHHNHHNHHDPSQEQDPPQLPSHLARAREHGPPGWEQKALRGAMPSHLGDDAGGTFMGMLARILLWKYKSTAPPQGMSAHRHLELLQDSTVPSMSSAPSAYWSDGWEIGTSTSIGTAA